MSFSPLESQGYDSHELQRRRRITYNDANRLEALYRPFVKKHQFADSVMNVVPTRNHFEIFGADLRKPNLVGNICRNGRHFYSLAANKLTDWHFTGDTHCLPLHRYMQDGYRDSNITEWGGHNASVNTTATTTSPLKTSSPTPTPCYTIPSTSKHTRLTLSESFPACHFIPNSSNGHGWVRNSLTSISATNRQPFGV